MRAALREPLAEAHGTAVACLTCELDFDDFREPVEARHFANVHNELHAHGQCLGAIAVDLDQSVPMGAGPTKSSSTDAWQALPAESIDVDEDGW